MRYLDVTPTVQYIRVHPHAEGKPAVGPPLQHGRGASPGPHRLSADLQPELDHRAARLQNTRSDPRRSDRPDADGRVSAGQCLKSVDRYTTSNMEPSSRFTRFG